MLALIRCDGELVDLKGNCSLAADVGLKRFTEGDSHLASYANFDSSNYARFLINSGFDPNADWTLEYTITPQEKVEIHASKFPSFISISSESSRVIAVFGSSILDYRQSVAVNAPDPTSVSFIYLDKNQSVKFSIQRVGNRIIVHKDGILTSNSYLSTPIITTTDYYLNIFTLTSGGTTGLGTIEEIRLTQAARYGLANYSIEPVFIQDNLPVPVYPKDPLYSDVVSLLRVQQGYMYDTKLNTISPNTTNSVKGYYLDAFNFTGQSSDVRNITLLDPLIDEQFTLEFTVKGEWVEGTKRVLSLFAVPSGLLLAVNLNQASMSVTVQGATSPSFLVEGGFDKVAIEWTRSAFVVYVNGAKVSTTPSSAVLDVGRIKFSDETNPFTGTLEEIRLTRGIRYAESYTPAVDVFPTRTLT